MSRLQTAVEEQYNLALDRKYHRDENSYTGYLYDQGLDKILKKCGEESFEVCIAMKNGKDADTLGEVNDVIYHVTVMLCLTDVSFDAVMIDLNRRCRTAGADLDDLSKTIARRREEDREVSYTAYLFRQGLDKILKKVGEATALLLLAAKDGDRDRIAGESGNLIYHLLAAMCCVGIGTEDLADEMERRNARIGNLKQFHSTDHST